MDELLQQQRVHAVDPQDDEAVISPPLTRTMAVERHPNHYEQQYRTTNCPGGLLQRVDPLPFAAIRLIHMFTRSAWRSLLGVLILVTTSVDAHAANKPNIVLITLDSVRADRSSMEPVMERMAGQSILFARAYAQSPLTIASTATILTGTYPQTHHASELGVPLQQTLPYLPDLLRAQGYQTAAFVGSILLDPRDGPFQGYDRGFDIYDAGFHQPQRGENRYQTVEHHGAEVVARATKWLAGRNQAPFFLWLHLSDPYGAAGSTYDRAVTETDAAVGKLVETLKAKGLYEDALVIVVSTHGESLGAHGEQMSGMVLYDETIHVPLILKLPHDQPLPSRNVSNHVRLLDIAPTVLQVAGIPVPSGMQGQSLLRIAQASSQADQPVYSQTDLPRQGFACSLMESWRVGKYLYVRAPNPELYDLSADPEATRSLAQSAKGTLQVLAAQLAAFDHHFDGEAGKPAVSRLTSAEMQKLASLGYIGLRPSASSMQEVKGIDPKDAVGVANQTLSGLLAADDGKPEQAIPLFHAVLAVRGNIYLAQYGMAVALSQQQHYPQAIGYLQSAIKLQPESPWAHYQMGISLLKTGDYKTASIHLEIAARLLPKSSAVHSALAEVYQHLGKTAAPVAKD